MASFEEMKKNFIIDYNDKEVKKRQKLLENKLKYLNGYNITIGKETMKNIFEAS